MSTTKISQRVAWGLFATCGLLWGTSFLWIKLALREIDPASIVQWRLLLGTVSLAIIAKIKHTPLGLRQPREKTFRTLLLLSLMNPTFPFLLITWSETQIASGLASILNATVPLFALVIAPLFLHDEKMGPRQALGLAMGFIGVVILANPGSSHRGSYLGIAAMLGAACLYAVSSIYSRRALRGYPPLAQSTWVMGIAGLVVLLMRRQFPQIPSLPLTWIAVSWMGILGTAIAFWAYFTLLNNWGATRTSLINYVFPVVGLLLGLIFLGEPLRLHLVIGAGAIMSGLALVGI